MKSHSPLFLDEIVVSVGCGHLPTARDRMEVAARIWADGAGERTSGLWHALHLDSAERLLSLRAADLALTGSGTAMSR